jgi:hypothetical protein
MFPMRFSTIFKSRWMALLWAVGILWFAYDFAESAPQEQASNNVTGAAAGVPLSSEEANKVSKALGD